MHRSGKWYSKSRNWQFQGIRTPNVYQQYEWLRQACPKCGNKHLVYNGDWRKGILYCVMHGCDYKVNIKEMKRDGKRM